VHPVLLSFSLPLLGEVVFPSYFTLLAFGFFAAMWLTTRRARHIGMDEVRVLDTNLWMFFWGLVGARVLHLIADGHFGEYVHMCTNPKLVPAIDAKVQTCRTAAECGYDYLCDAVTQRCYPPQDCLAVFKLWRGGFAYYGGFLFAVAFAIHYTRKHAMGFWRTADLAAPAIALGLFFGRVGCFLNGCCYGKPTKSSLGVIFPRGGSVWREQWQAHLIGRGDAALPVHPTQLYEAFGCLVLFALLYFVVSPRVRRHGDVFAGLLIGYGVLRSIIEIFRDDDRGVLFGWLSTSQIISVPLIVGGVVLLLSADRRPAVAPVG
jgi:phosphatidylglycerol:prolipoprotein diacylglycerol transferase